MNAIEGIALRDAGMARVMESEGDWASQLDAYFFRFLAQAPDTFTWDDFRTFAESQGIEQPHHPNAWAASFKRFARHLEFCGVTTSTRPTAHARMVRQYRRATHGL
jgi:hypothetical protein